MELAHHWWRRTLTRRTAPLVPVSWLFRAVVAARRALFRTGVLETQRLPVPVLVVGNLTVGGSGKTPLVIHLARALAARGKRPGVISRGYGGTARGVVEVLEHSRASDCGDEPLLIKRRTGCPVFVAADRVAAGRALVARYPQTGLVIADDGLQHLRLARDFEIAVFDARGVGNGHLLPAGPLREPMARLRALDAVVYNDNAVTAGAQGYAMRLVQGEFYRLDGAAPPCPPDRFAGRHGRMVAAVAGIGNPERFFASLRALGLTIDEHPFPDHHAFTPAELTDLRADRILMTEKDALKCLGFGDPRIWVVPIEAAVDAKLVDSIMEKLFGPETA